MAEKRHQNICYTQTNAWVSHRERAGEMLLDGVFWKFKNTFEISIGAYLLYMLLGHLRTFSISYTMFFECIVSVPLCPLPPLLSFSPLCFLEQFCFSFYDIYVFLCIYATSSTCKWEKTWGTHLSATGSIHLTWLLVSWHELHTSFFCTTGKQAKALYSFTSVGTEVCCVT